MSVSPDGEIYTFCHLVPCGYNANNYVGTTEGFHVMKYDSFDAFLAERE